MLETNEQVAHDRTRRGGACGLQNGLVQEALGDELVVLASVSWVAVEHKPKLTSGESLGRGGIGTRPSLFHSKSCRSSPFFKKRKVVEACSATSLSTANSLPCKSPRSVTTLTLLKPPYMQRKRKVVRCCPCISCSKFCRSSTWRWAKGLRAAGTPHPSPIHAFP